MITSVPSPLPPRSPSKPTGLRMGSLFFVIFGAVLLAGALLYSFAQSRAEAQQIRESTTENAQKTKEMVERSKARRACLDAANKRGSGWSNC